MVSITFSGVFTHEIVWREMSDSLLLMKNSQAHKLFMQQKPINDDHLGQVDESWYLRKRQINTTKFQPSEVKHLHLNEMLYWLT